MPRARPPDRRGADAGSGDGAPRGAPRPTWRRRAADLLQRTGDFFRELRARHVIHVALVYAAAAFAVLEGAQLIFSEFDLPRTVFSWLVVLAVAGFPVAVGLSWAYELTAEGVRRDAGASEAGPLAAPGNDAHGPGTSIAVLPFVDMSPGRDQEHFADGISDELITALAQVEGLRVVARTSAFAFKGKEQDVREIGRLLQVQSVLEGSVRRWDDRLRVNAQLVDVADGYEMWSARYDAELADVFSVQDRISAAIVDTLRLELALDQNGPSAHIPTANPRAWDRYLKGRHCWYRRYKVGLQTAMEHFQAAIAEDPDFPHPYAGVADTLISLGVFAFLDPAQARAKAHAAVQRAMALDPNIAAVHFSTAGLNFFYGWKWEAAENEFLRTLALNPNHGEAYGWWGIMEALRGNMERGFELTAEARRVDPDSPYVAFIDALLDFYGRHHDRGLPKLRKVLEEQPELPTALFVQGDIFSVLDRHDEALECFEKAAAVTNRAPLFLCGLGSARARAGDPGAAERIRRELQARARTEYVTPVSLAVCATSQNDLDAAFRHLDAAVEERSPSLLVSVLLPIFDPIRSDPRYAPLMGRIRMGF